MMNRNFSFIYFTNSRLVLNNLIYDGAVWISSELNGTKKPDIRLNIGFFKLLLLKEVNRYYLITTFSV